jgi:hypothetical protein
MGEKAPSLRIARRSGFQVRSLEDLPSRRGSGLSTSGVFVSGIIPVGCSELHHSLSRVPVRTRIRHSTQKSNTAASRASTIGSARTSRISFLLGRSDTARRALRSASVT